jgi:uncharacterized protein YjiS (DUF1127 family)
MARIETAGTARTQTFDLFAALHAATRMMLRRHRERRLLARLSRLDPHVIRDMGFDPDSIYDELDGSWDEIDPGRYRNR